MLTTLLGMKNGKNIKHCVRVCKLACYTSIWHFWTDHPQPCLPCTFDHPQSRSRCSHCHLSCPAPFWVPFLSSFWNCLICFLSFAPPSLIPNPNKVLMFETISSSTWGEVATMRYLAVRVWQLCLAFLSIKKTDQVTTAQPFLWCSVTMGTGYAWPIW